MKLIVRFLRPLALALLLAFALPQGAFATASILQTGHNETNSSVATLASTPTSLTAGSTVLVYVGLNHFYGVTSVVGSVNGAYTLTDNGADDSSGATQFQVWRHANVASGSETITVTFDAARSNVGMIWVEVGGVKTSPVDVIATGRVQTSPGATTDAVTSSAATSTAQPAIIIAGSYSAASAPNVGTGYTNGMTVDWSPAGQGGAVRIESERITGTGSQTATFTATASTSTHLNTMVILDENSAPILSSAPAFSASTTSSITDVATSSESGTLYGVLVTSGSGAPTCTQIKAGQNSAGTTAYASANVSATATVSASVAFTTLTSGAVKDGYFCVHGSTSGTDSAVYTLLNQYKTAAFSVTPSVTARATTSYTVGETLDGAGNVYVVACKVTDAAATVAQVKAGQCTGNATALAASNKAVTGADTHSLTGLNTATRPIYSVYVVGTYGTHDSAVTTLASQVLAAPTGQQYVVADVPWSGAADSVFANASPAVADGDVWMSPVISTPSSYALTAGVDGTFQIAAAGDHSRQQFISNVYDVSADAWYGSFTTYVNDQLPACAALPTTITGAPGVLSIQTGVAIAAVDWNKVFTDPENDALTIALSPSSPNTQPSNLTLTTGVLAGSITSAGSSSLIYRATDIAGEHTDCPTWTIGASSTVTVPTVTGQSFTQAAAALAAMSLAVPADQQTYSCRRVTAYDQILAQTPAAGATVNPFTTMHLTVAKACSFFNAPVVQ